MATTNDHDNTPFRQVQKIPTPYAAKDTVQFPAEHIEELEWRVVEATLAQTKSGTWCLKQRHTSQQER
jgi:hypothetical protein